MSRIILGPTGIGPVNDAVANLESYAKMGFKAAEVLFTYGVYIKNKEDADFVASMLLGSHYDYCRKCGLGRFIGFDSQCDVCRACESYRLWVLAQRIIKDWGLMNES